LFLPSLGKVKVFKSTAPAGTSDSGKSAAVLLNVRTTITIIHWSSDVPDPVRIELPRSKE
jgi:hypothetical protein